MHAPRLCGTLITGFCVGLFMTLSALADPPTGGEVPTRDQIDQKYKWDLTDIYESRSAWEADFKRMEGVIAELAKLKGTLVASPDALRKALETTAQASVEFSKIVVYAHQTLHEDGGMPSSQEMAKRAVALATRFGEAVSWMQPEILTVPEETLRSWCKSDPKLALYEHYLDNIVREKAHTLDARGEELLAMTGQMAATPNDAYSALMNVDLTFPKIKDEQGAEVELSETRHYMFRNSPDRRVRKDSFMGTMKAHIPLKNTIASLLAGSVHGSIFQSRARGFDSSLQAALFSSNIPDDVYHNLVKTINANLPLLHRYAKLRKRVLGVDELHIYDLYCPMVKGPDQKYTYEQSVDMVLDGLEPMGDEYLVGVRKAFDSHWIDVYETKGKRSGAYSWGTYLVHPFMLLNFNGTFDAVSTVAHEMGHTMHSYFTYANQPPIYGDYATFVAEVASTTNEIIMQEYWLERAQTKEEKLFLLDQFLDSIRQTVFRQTMFAEFELAMHQAAERGEALTAERLGKMYLDTMQKYYGPTLVMDPEAEVYGLRIHHFFRSFYVYQYATSYSAAATLAIGIMEHRPGALEAYLDFLRSGSSDYPIHVLKKAGVDMTTPKPIEDCMKRFETLLDRFEKLLAS